MLLMDKLQSIRVVVNSVLEQQPDPETRHWGFVHLYGVSATCVLLAFSRGLDAQLAAVAGMLHDIWTHKTGDPTDHARFSALEAEKILENVGGFDSEEIARVCAAISRHSDKDALDGGFDELLKDADVLQHGLNSPAIVEKLLESGQGLPEISAPWLRRWKRVSRELGLVQSGAEDE